MAGTDRVEERERTFEDLYRSVYGRMRELATPIGTRRLERMRDGLYGKVAMCVRWKERQSEPIYRAQLKAVLAELRDRASGKTADPAPPPTRRVAKPIVRKRKGRKG